ASGEGYWDSPLANQPPAFTILLVYSHAVLGRPGDGFPLLGRRAGFYSEREIAHARAPWDGVRAQLWATVPTVLSDLASVVLLFLLVRRFAGPRAAIVASAAFAVDPLALFCAHRILSNSTLATATLGCVLGWSHARAPRGFAIAGVLGGLAVLVKVSAI